MTIDADIFSDKLYLRRVSVTLVNQSGGHDFEGLRIKFEVEKTNESQPNRARISIYNLSEKSRSMFEDGGSRVILTAGYKDNFGVIFSGNIVKAKHKKKKGLQKGAVTTKYEGVDIITEIEAGDGDNKYRNSRLHRGFPAGTPIKDVLQELSGAFDMPANIDEEAIPSLQYANGYSVDGPCRYALDEICKTNGLEWSIQNEVLQIISKNKTTKIGAIVLNPTSGLIGSPTKMSKGVEFVSLLQPALSPGCAVKLESKFIEGTFKVRKVTHDGDSHEGDFVSKCEATL